MKISSQTPFRRAQFKADPGGDTQTAVPETGIEAWDEVLGAKWPEGSFGEEAQIATRMRAQGIPVATSRPWQDLIKYPTLPVKEKTSFSLPGFELGVKLASCLLAHRGQSETAAAEAEAPDWKIAR